MDIQVRGVPQVGRTIGRLVKSLSFAYRVQTERALDDLEKVAAEYPPETDANAPGHGPYYVRGVGQAYQRLDGETTIYPTSEKLGQSWVKRIVARGLSIVGKVGPRASYGPYVVGGQQAPYHAKTGWPTLAGTVSKEFRRVVQGFVAATVRVVRGN